MLVYRTDSESLAIAHAPGQLMDRVLNSLEIHYILCTCICQSPVIVIIMDCVAACADFPSCQIYTRSHGII